MRLRICVRRRLRRLSVMLLLRVALRRLLRTASDRSVTMLLCVTLALLLRVLAGRVCGRLTVIFSSPHDTATAINTNSSNNTARHRAPTATDERERRLSACACPSRAASCASQRLSIDDLTFR
jgi:hypothetical protein